MDFFLWILSHSLSKNTIKTCLSLLPAFVFVFQPTKQTARGYQEVRKVFLELVNKLKDHLLLGNGSRVHRTGRVKPAGMWQLAS